MFYSKESFVLKYALLQGITTAGDFAKYLKLIRKLKASWEKEEIRILGGRA